MCLNLIAASKYLITGCPELLTITAESGGYWATTEQLNISFNAKLTTISSSVDTADYFLVRLISCTYYQLNSNALTLSTVDGVLSQLASDASYYNVNIGWLVI
jgi:hypothetical protein